MPTVNRNQPVIPTSNTTSGEVTVDGSVDPTQVTGFADQSGFDASAYQAPGMGLDPNSLALLAQFYPQLMPIVQQLMAQQGAVPQTQGAPQSVPGTYQAQPGTGYQPDGGYTATVPYIPTAGTEGAPTGSAPTGYQPDGGYTATVPYIPTPGAEGSAPTGTAPTGLAPGVQIDPYTNIATNSAGQQVNPMTGEPVYPTPTAPQGSNPTQAGTQPAPESGDPERAEFLKQSKALLEGMINPRAMGSLGMGYGSMIMGDVDKEQLEKIAKDGSYPAKFRQAAEYMLKPENAERFKQLETGRGDTDVDDNISISDLKDEIKRLESEERTAKVQGGSSPEFLEALETMSKYEGDFDAAGSSSGFSRDNKRTMEDIDAILDPKNEFPADLVKAAQFFKSNPELWDMMDIAHEGGDKDGSVSKDDLDAILKQVKAAVPEQPAQPAQPEQPQTVSQLSFRRNISG